MPASEHEHDWLIMHSVSCRDYVNCKGYLYFAEVTRRLNAHDALVAACEAALECLRDEPHPEEGGDWFRSGTAEALRDAIAKARS